MIRYLLALLLAMPAIGAPVTLNWTLPTRWADGRAIAPVACSATVLTDCWYGATAVCGVTAGRYTTGRGGLGALTSLTFELAQSQWCAVELHARRADVAGEITGSLSTEVRVPVLDVGSPVGVSVTVQSSAACTTTTECVINRSR